MKNPSSLAKQVKHAKKIFNSWTPEKQLSIRLHGSGDYTSHIKPEDLADAMHDRVHHEIGISRPAKTLSRINPIENKHASNR